MRSSMHCFSCKMIFNGLNTIYLLFCSFHKYVCVCVCVCVFSIRCYGKTQTEFLANVIHMCIDIHRPPWWLSGKESAHNVGHAGLIPGWGRSPGEGNGNPLQYSCLGNPMDRGTCLATVHGVTRVGHNLTTNPLPPYVCVCVCVCVTHTRPISALVICFIPLFPVVC